MHHSPVHNSSILENCDCRQSFTHDNISCRDKLSVVTLVEYTFTAISAMIVAHEVIEWLMILLKEVEKMEEEKTQEREIKWLIL